MKINRLNAIVVVVVAILVVGALVYYEVMRSQPQETVASAPTPAVSAPTPAAEAPAPAAVPPTTAEQPAAETPAAPAALAPDAGKSATAEPPAPPAATPSTSNSTTADVHTPPPPTTAGGQVVPSFDVVRVEPTGETVVAGNAEPDSKVEVLDGPTAVATATANPQGDWALALDNALKPGTHDLAIRTTSKDGSVSTLSDERVAVQVPEPGSKDVIVVLNAPNQPSRVFELPKGEAQKPAAPGTPQVATAEPPPAATQPAPPSQTPQASGETPPPAASAPAAPAAQPGSEQAQPAQPAQPPQPAEAAQPSQPAETAQQTQPTQPASPAQPAPAANQQAEATKPAQPGQAVAPPAQPVQPSGEAPATQAAQPAAQPPQPSQAAQPPQPAQATQPAQPAPPPTPTPTVVVSAVEADTAGTLYVAGTATTDEPVRAYLNDKLLGEAKPSPSGTWLVEVHREVPPGAYQVRADQVSPQDGSVIARAEVPFERKIDVASLNASGSAGASGTAGVSAALPQVQTVIIKRGDNLWTIARNTWGKGIRWSTLYQANKDQIRNPHWIYPGQVFVMPVSPSVVKD